jgi:hypothetical protein
MTTDDTQPTARKSKKRQPKEKRLEIIDVIKQSEPSRTEHYITRPSAYGELRLDISGDAGTALTDTITQDDVNTISNMMDTSYAKYNAGDAEGAEKQLLDTIKQFPYCTPCYNLVYSFYNTTGNPKASVKEAEYYLKQLIALEPSYENLGKLARFLLEQSRFDEATVLHEHLWETRSQSDPEIARQATIDYLVTLSNQMKGSKMIEIANEALAEFGSDTVMVYEQILGYVIDGQLAIAKGLLDRQMPNVDPSDVGWSRYDNLYNLVQRNLTPPSPEAAPTDAKG